MSVSLVKSEREFHYSIDDFEFIRELVGTHAGIVLSDIKKDMVYGRLARRLRALGLNSFSEYREILNADPDGPELGELVNAITTNLTSFFREAHHFECLKDVVIPSLLTRNAGKRLIRIWSAGCSSGEEPYSIAITAKEALESYRSWTVRILATDLDSHMVERGESGIYRPERIEGLSAIRQKRWFRKVQAAGEEQVQVARELRDMVIYRQLNLHNPWPIKGGVDVIFCRNVVIYFNKDTQRILFNRFADLLADDGYLFIGHSESLFKVSDRFRALGRTVYQKIA